MSKLPSSLWRVSSTLIMIARNGLKLKKTDPFDYSVLLLQRSAKTRFMPGNYVFPGGVIDQADYDDNWMNLYDKSFKAFSTDFSSLLDIKGPRPTIFNTSSTSVPSEVALRICAIRETFEESGVLLLKKIHSTASEHGLIKGCISVIEKELSDQEINKWRTAVHKDATKFIELCRNLNSVPDVWSLSEWSNWRTPVDLKIRFDTAFFTCFCDYEPAAQHDEKEIIHSLWLTPLEAVKDYYAQKYRLGPPQLYTIAQLFGKSKWDELKTFQENRARDGVNQTLPIRIECKDAICAVFPGDDMYNKLLTHIEEIARDKNWKEDNSISPIVFHESYHELEKGIVNFHRFLAEKSKLPRLKVNCTPLGGALPPSNQILEYLTDLKSHL